MKKKVGKLKIVKIAHVPEYLDGRSDHIYRTICHDLISRGILYSADLPHIAAYAATMAKYEEMVKKLSDMELCINTKKGPIVNPLIGKSAQLLVVLNATAQKLGITPYGRGVSKRETKPKDEENHGGLAAILNIGS